MWTACKVPSMNRASWRPHLFGSLAMGCGRRTIRSVGAKPIRRWRQQLVAARGGPARDRNHLRAEPVRAIPRRVAWWAGCCARPPVPANHLGRPQGVADTECTQLPQVFRPDAGAAPPRNDQARAHRAGRDMASHITGAHSWRARRNDNGSLRVQQQTRDRGHQTIVDALSRGRRPNALDRVSGSPTIMNRSRVYHRRGRESRAVRPLRHGLLAPTCHRLNPPCGWDRAVAGFAAGAWAIVPSMALLPYDVLP